MNYETFLNTICHEMEVRTLGRLHVTLTSVLKNNGQKLDGVVLAPTGGEETIFTPTIYLNTFYEDYRNGLVTLDRILAELLAIFDSAPSSPMLPEIEHFFDYEAIRGNIILQLINREWNAELLADVPHIPYLDLAIVFRVRTGNFGFGETTVLVRSSHLEDWGVDLDTVYQDAMKNSPRILPVECKEMSSLLKEYESRIRAASGEEAPEDPDDTEDPENVRSPFLVLTNQSRVLGASVILYPKVLQIIADWMERDFYLLPSSIHEFILLPYKPDIKPEDLGEMVRFVNTKGVESTECLSDHAYRYLREEERLISV